MKHRILTLLAAIVLATLAWTTVYYNNHQPPPVTDLYPVYYAKIASVYVGDLDGYPAAFVSKEVLEEAAPTFVDIPILVNHDQADVSKCIGRTVSAKVAYDDKRQQWYLEVVAKIVDPAAIAKIKNDLYHAVSVSFSIKEATCSIDTNDIRECAHTMGRPYKINNKWVIARAVVKHIRGHEISFVNVPGSSGARILDLSTDASQYSASK